MNTARNTHIESTATPIKDKFVNELIHGTYVDTVFVLTEKESRISDQAGRYLVCTLSDRSGSIRGLQFDRKSFADIPPRGAAVHVKGRVEVHGRNRRIKITSLEPAAHYDSADFVASSLRPLDEMRVEYARILKSIEDSYYLKIATALISSKEAFNDFLGAPASTHDGGAYRGAAVEKSLRLARLVNTLSALYPRADKSLLMAGALFHLVGSVQAFKYDTSISLTQRGEMFSPVVLSALKLEKLSRASNVQLSKRAQKLQALFMSVEGGTTNKQLVEDIESLEAPSLETAIFKEAYSLLASADQVENRLSAKIRAGY